MISSRDKIRELKDKCSGKISYIIKEVAKSVSSRDRIIELKSKCSGKIAHIIKEVAKSADCNEYCAWGQFATDNIVFSRQRGVSGTSAAIQILSHAKMEDIEGRGRDDVTIDKGKEYLRNEYTEVRCSDNPTIGSFYKYTSFLSGLSEPDTDNQILSKDIVYFNQLWKMKSTDGWHDSVDEESREENDLASVIALFTLSEVFCQTDKFLKDEGYDATKEDYISGIRKVKSRIKHQASEQIDELQESDSNVRSIFIRREITKVSFLLLLLCKINGYDIESEGEVSEIRNERADVTTTNYHNGADTSSDSRNRKEGCYSADIKELSGDLMDLIDNITVDSDPYHLRTYYIREKSENEDLDFRYQPFLLDAIAALSLIRSGYAVQYSDFITSTVDFYLSSIGEEDIFEPNREPAPPISDNLWVVRLIYSFKDCSFDGFIIKKVEMKLQKITLEQIARKGILVVITISAFAVYAVLDSCPGQALCRDLPFGLTPEISRVLAVMLFVLLTNVLFPQISSIITNFASICWRLVVKLISSIGP